MPSDSLLPTFHSNGSSPSWYYEMYKQAWIDLRIVKERVRDTGPHMRDYYVRADGQAAFDQALAEHYSRLKALDEMINTYQELMLHAQTAAKKLQPNNKIS